ncbi:MAG: hypothetical protein JO263_03335 [Candidatus Eremiobacteraeota bacterium]|nr:hypothetical protein [Candidatus Eremiobacteraeota bacterium]
MKVDGIEFGGSDADWEGKAFVLLCIGVTFGEQLQPASMATATETHNIRQFAPEIFIAVLLRTGPKASAFAVI